MNLDDDLIYESYKQSLLTEDTILDKIYKKLKEGIHKEDFVYILRLIKSRSEYYYKSLMKKIRRYVQTGTTGLAKHDRIAEYVIIIMMNIVAFPIAVATVDAINKGLDDLNPYLKQHRSEIIQFIDEIEQEVGHMKDSVTNLADKLSK
jgi:hypothetical protein